MRSWLGLQQLRPCGFRYYKPLGSRKPPKSFQAPRLLRTHPRGKSDYSLVKEHLLMRPETTFVASVVSPTSVVRISRCRQWGGRYYSLISPCQQVILLIFTSFEWPVNFVFRGLIWRRRRTRQPFKEKSDKQPAAEPSAGRLNLF